MPRDPLVAEYVRALVKARQRANAIDRATVQRIADAFSRASADLAREAGNATNALNKARLNQLRRQLDAVLRDLEAKVVTAVTTGANTTIRDIVHVHEDALRVIEDRAGAIELVTRLTDTQTRVLATYATRGGTAKYFKTLVNRNMRDAAPALDDLLESALTRGVSSARLTKDVAQLLAGGAIETADTYGLASSKVSGLRTLFSDARRIAVSEINNAQREANARSMADSRVVAAAKWQISGAHAREDACDTIAETDLYGLGPGYYDPRAWPAAPHPYCACYAGDIKLRPMSEWNRSRGAIPHIDRDAEVYRPAGVSENEADRAVATVLRNARLVRR